MTILIYGQEVTPFIPYVGDGLEPITYSILPTLPTGLSFNTSNGEITGTPTVISTPTNYTITWIDDLSQTDNQVVSIAVDYQLTATVLISDLVLTAGPAVVEFTPVEGSGGIEPFVYSISPDLPSGINIIPEIGKIAGSVIQISSLTNHIVTITDLYGQTTSGSFTLTVDPIALTTIQQVPSRNFTIGQLITPFIPVLASGGYGGVTYSISPSLSSGLAFNTATGQITGTPTALITGELYTITVTDSIGQTDNNTFSLTVSPVALTSIRLVPNKLLTINQLITPFTAVLGSGGYSTLTYSILPGLPTGVLYNSTNGQITGTPSVLSSSTNYTVTITDSASQISTQTFFLEVDPVPLSITRPIANKSITVDLVSTPFTPVVATGGYGAIQYSIGSSLPTGLTFNTGTGAISGTPTVLSTETSYLITVTDEVNQSGLRSFFLSVDPPALTTVLNTSTKVLLVNILITPFTPVTAVGGYGTSTYSISPALPNGLEFSTSTGLISGTSSEIIDPSNYTITVQDSAAQTSSKVFSLNVLANPFQLDTALDIPSVELIKNLSVTPFKPVSSIGGNGRLIYFSVPALPALLTINSSTGIISGTPTETSSATSYTITIVDELNQQSSRAFSLSVTAPLLSATSNFATIELNQDVTNANVIPVSGNGGYGTLIYAVAPVLPTGLLFSTSTGRITGIPSQSSSATEYTVTITDQIQQSTSATFSLTVNQLFFSTAFTLTEGIFVSRPIAALVTGTNYTVISGRLPSGLTLSTDGVLTGKPDPVLDISRSRFVVRARNLSTLIDRTFNVDVVGADEPEWSTAAGFLSVGINGEQYALNNQWVDYNISATAVEAPTGTQIRYYIGDGDGRLPPGLSLSQDGKISGFIKDKLTFDSNIGAEGGYDTESYDGYSYDHAAGFIGTNSDLTITGLPKIYQFRVTATDGVQQKTRTFKIVVASIDILQYNSTSMPVDIVISTTTNYIQYPQWIKGSDLGTIRANNNQILDVTVYDGAPLVGTVTYAILAGPDISTRLPEGLYLNTSTGYIHGFLPYQPAYTKSYSLTVNATKNDKNTDRVATVTNTFSLAVKGEVESTIEWVSGSDLGSIEEGITSELAIVAKQIQSDYTLKYQKKSGTVPSGLTLERDGSISGQADYGSTGTYTFTVIALDVYELSAIEREFSLTVKQYDDKRYTKIWVRPFLSTEKRNAYKEFIANDFTFDPHLIYRYFDPNFGVQSEIKMILEFGLEKLNLADYVPALKENFYRKRFYFGDVKIAIANDQQGNPLYEVVYLDMTDNLVNNQGKSVNQVIHYNNEIYYPNSADNMRKRLETIVLDDYTYIGVNLDTTPKFMTTPQAGYYKPTEYIRAVPICYALPGQGNKIVSRIKLSKFDFKAFDFEVDRLIVQNSLDNSTAKYLIFERQSIGDKLVTDDYLFGSDDVRLDTDSDDPLTRE